MKKNLFQKTVYEVYKAKENFGYKIIETPHMFIILWNDQSISGLNVAHCEKFTFEEFDFIENNLKNIDICIASNIQADIGHAQSRLKFDEIATAMLFEASDTLKENKDFDIKPVLNQQDLDLFCNIAGDVFHMKEEVPALQKSLSFDLELSSWHKYIGYKDNIPAGIIETARGSEATLISWAGVREDFRRQGLCRAMLTHTINNEIKKGYHKFVLVATQAGQKVYSDFGFQILSSRYDYILENSSYSKNG